MKQVRIGNEYGNVPETFTKVVDTEVASLDEGEHFQWSDGAEIPFWIKTETAGKIEVSLIGDKDTKILLPFEAGWNRESVYRIYMNASNTATGIYAGR